MNALALPDLLRWVAEMPSAFRAEPQGLPNGMVRVRAVVADLHSTLSGTAAPDDLLAAMEPRDASRGERNRLRWVLAAAHMLWHPTLRVKTPAAAAALRSLLVRDIPPLAAIVPVEQLDADEERREELVRLALRSFGLRLVGEGAQDADDRLKQVDSVERRRVLAAASERERRAREVREAIAKKAAQEAAAKVSRE